MENTRETVIFKLTYFKKSGKYYSSSDFTVENCTIIHTAPNHFTVYMDDGVQELKRLQKLGESPGLVRWSGEFHTLIDHEEGYPVLLLN